MNKLTLMVEQTRVQLANRQRVLMICPDDGHAERVLEMLSSDTLPPGLRKEVRLMFDNGASMTIRVVRSREGERQEKGGTHP